MPEFDSRKSLQLFQPARLTCNSEIEAILSYIALIAMFPKLLIVLNHAGLHLAQTKPTEKLVDLLKLYRTTVL